MCSPQNLLTDERQILAANHSWLREHAHLFETQYASDSQISWLAGQLGTWSAPPLRYLDIGCGPGDGSFVVRAEDEYVGIDHAPEVVDIARQRNPRAKFEVAEASALPFESAGFDRLLFVNLLQHIPTGHARRCFEECARVLKPTGRMFVLWMCGGEEGWMEVDGAARPWWYCLHRPTQVAEALASSGWKVPSVAPEQDASGYFWFWCDRHP
jgi:SAM-dependent methyltransferase